MSGRRTQGTKGNGNSKRPGQQTKGQRLDSMARKREERAARTANKKQKQAQTYHADDENYVTFAAQLVKMGLELREIPGDGNCLFRALGDQLEGHSRDHLKHRHDVVKYMLDNRADFEPFVEDDVPFDRHTKNLNEIGTYAGNDAIVAFARLYKLHVVIHQVNSPCWQIHGTDDSSAKELHISYHNGDHYSSIRKLGDHTETPANIKLSNGSLLDTPAKGGKKPKQTNGYKAAWDPSNESYYDESTYNGEYSEEYLENLHLSEVTGEEAGMAKAVRTEDDAVETIMRMTGCEDKDLVRNTLADIGYDMETAVEIVCEFMTTSGPGCSQSQCSSGAALWGESGTGSRIFGGQVNGERCPNNISGSSGAKPKLKQESASQRQRSKKLEKKARATERRRQERLGTTAPSGGGSSDEDYHIVSDKMGTLKI